MSKTQYAYAVARIRALEVSLFSSSTIEQLIACKDDEAAIRFLQERGWGGADVPADADAILTREREKIWETIGEMHVDMDVFDVLSYTSWFHNLKAAVMTLKKKSNQNIQNAVLLSKVLYGVSVFAYTDTKSRASAHHKRKRL